MIARIVAWLMRLIKRPTDPKNDGYWGGVTMWDRLRGRG